MVDNKVEVVGMERVLVVVVVVGMVVGRVLVVVVVASLGVEVVGVAGEKEK